MMSLVEKHRACCRRRACRVSWQSKASKWRTPMKCRVMRKCQRRRRHTGKPRCLAGVVLEDVGFFGAGEDHAGGLNGFSAKFRRCSAGFWRPLRLARPELLGKEHLPAIDRKWRQWRRPTEEYVDESFVYMVYNSSDGEKQILSGEMVYCIATRS
ncbi:hypothetical protein SUGI_0210380 [Cryptomeria japonica]|nr:hypothetical protein SUGI_0210380 [Cryptomeria japonica]